MSPIGLQELHSRFAFEFNRADNVCIWNRLIILPGSNLELSNEEIATNENTNEEITYIKTHRDTISGRQKLTILIQKEMIVFKIRN